MNKETIILYAPIERMEDLEENREVYKGIDKEMKKGDSNE